MELNLVHCRTHPLKLLMRARSLLFDTDLHFGEYDFAQGRLLLRENSEYQLSALEKGCIASKSMPDETGFVPVCWFKKIKSSEHKYTQIIDSISESNSGVS